MSFGVSQPTASTKRPYNINDAETSTNQDNIPVLYGAGVFKATVDWVATLYNLTSKNVKSAGDGKGKASSSSGQKDWYADIAGITNICPDDAPNDAILFILVNDEVAFTGPLSRAPGTYYASFSIPKYCTSCRFYWGMKDQPADTLVLFPRQDAVPSGVDPRDISTWPRLNSSGDPVDNVTELPGIANPLSGHYDFHPPYRNQGLFVAQQFFLGSSPNAPTVVFVLARGTKFFSGARFEAGETGVNPMGPQYEILHDDLFGCGLPDSKLDATSFTNTATALTAAGMFLSPVLINPGSGRSIFTNYFLYFDGFLRRNGSTIEAGYFSHGDIDVPGLPSVGSDDLVGEPNIKPGNLADTKNCFFVAYTNRAKWWKDDDTERYIDQGNFLKVKRERQDRLERQFIIDGDIAVRHGVEWGKIFALEPVNGDAFFGRERVSSRRVGDRFKTDVASLALSYVWRITKAEWPSDRDGTVKFTLENERGIWPTLFIPPPAPKPADFVIKAAAITNARIVELPSGELKDGGAVQIAILAQRPSTDILGFKIYVSVDNTTFDLAGTQHHFAAFGKVRSTAYLNTTADLDTAVGMIVDLLGTDLGIVADSSQTDQQRDDRNLLSFVDSEIMSVGGVTALGAGREKLFQRRALYGTAKATHFVDANCWFIFRDWIDPIGNKNFLGGTTRYFKLVPFIFGGDYDISSVTSIAYVFHSTPAVGSIFDLVLTTDAKTDEIGNLQAYIYARWSFLDDQEIILFTVAWKKSSEDDSAWVYRTIDTPDIDLPVTVGVSYDVKVRPINQYGGAGDYCTVATIVAGTIDLFSISGLQLAGQGSDLTLYAPDAHLTCRLNSPAQATSIQGGPNGVSNGAYDPLWVEFEWKFYKGSLTLAQIESGFVSIGVPIVRIFRDTSTQPNYGFTLEKHDISGISPWHDYQFTVWCGAFDKSNRSASPQVIVITKPRAAAATNGLYTPTLTGVVLYFDLPVDPCRKKINIFMDASQDESNPGGYVGTVGGEARQTAVDGTGNAVRAFFIQLEDCFGLKSTNLSIYPAQSGLAAPTSGWGPSIPVSSLHNDLLAPVFAPDGGALDPTPLNLVRLFAQNPNVQIYYRLDGTTPILSDNLYDPASPIAVGSSPTTITAAVYHSGAAVWGPAASRTFTLNPSGGGGGTPQVVAPDFDPPSGSFVTVDGTQDLTIATPTAADAIFYTRTTNGDAPATPTHDGSGNATGGTIKITGNTALYTLGTGRTRVKALGYKTGWTDSAVADGDFRVTRAIGGPGGGGGHLPP